MRSGWLCVAPHPVERVDGFASVRPELCEAVTSATIPSMGFMECGGENGAEDRGFSARLSWGNPGQVWYGI